jgi:hypothetical protein
MTYKQILFATTSSLLLATGLGCAHNYPPPPPPPPPIAQAPPIIQLAEHNGFEMGRSEGAGAAANGFPFAPRRTRAYHDTPGYDSQLGPFGPYQNAFRNAYLRGYDKGFYRR